MRRMRVIPCLLVQGHGLVKTIKFKDPVYVGDPVNTTRIFSDKEADEIVVLDIDASRVGAEPNYKLIEAMAGEAFMPMAYGGGVTNLNQIRQLIRCGIEKIVINSAAVSSREWIREAVDVFGSQAIVGAVDVKKNLLGNYRVMTHSATVDAKVDLDQHVENLVSAGVGEIFLNSIDRDGMMAGYDLALIQRVARSTSLPVMVCGGAGSVEHLIDGFRNGASAVAAGSMFVFYGKHRGVLISYLSPSEMRRMSCR